MLSSVEILELLKTNDQQDLDWLWREADVARQKHVGSAVHLRGLIEISNYCARSCWYCGINCHNSHLARYRMSADEIWLCVQLATNFEYGTVVLQAGEDPGIERNWLAELVSSIKAETDLAVTLSLGERSQNDLECWRQAGADRYLLRFETSDRQLFEKIHPPLQKSSDRFEMLQQLAQLGYQVGSGVMVGLPGQSYHSLVDDIFLFSSLKLDMVGIGPFIPVPDTPLYRQWHDSLGRAEQVPNTVLMAYKVLALTRIVVPNVNLPATTALGSLDKAGRAEALQRGANVIMPNLTPARYASLYQIYPQKKEMSRDYQANDRLIKDLIIALGREVGRGPGSIPQVMEMPGPFEEPPA